MNLSIHGIVKIKVQQLTDRLNSGAFHRQLVIQDSHGQEFYIDLFAREESNLILVHVADRELL